MKAITIKQPYATLISEGLKKYEFRTWKTKFRGELLIHASKNYDKKEMEKYKDTNLNFQTEAIICKVSLTHCESVDENLIKELKKKNKKVYQNIIEDYESGKWKGYAFRLENVRKIKPIKAKGRLSLWNYIDNGD